MTRAEVVVAATIGLSAVASGTRSGSRMQIVVAGTKAPLFVHASLRIASRPGSWKAPSQALTSWQLAPSIDAHLGTLGLPPRARGACAERLRHPHGKAGDLDRGRG